VSLDDDQDGFVEIDRLLGSSGVDDYEDTLGLDVSGYNVSGNGGYGNGVNSPGGGGGEGGGEFGGGGGSNVHFICSNEDVDDWSDLVRLF
jgi:hypothetical protein